LNSNLRLLDEAGFGTSRFQNAYLGGEKGVGGQHKDAAEGDDPHRVRIGTRTLDGKKLRISKGAFRLRQINMNQRGRESWRGD